MTEDPREDPITKDSKEDIVTKETKEDLLPKTLLGLGRELIKRRVNLAKQTTKKNY